MVSKQELQGWHIWAKSLSDWHQMGQIGDFLISRVQYILAHQA